MHSLDFFPNTAIIRRAGGSERFEIPTIPSPFEKLAQDFDQLNLPLLASNVQAIASAMRTFTEDDAFQRLPQTAQQTLASSTELADQLKRVIERLEPKLEQTMASTTAAALTAERELPTIARQIQASLEQLNVTLASVEQTAHDTSALLDPDQPTMYNLNYTLNEISRAARSLNLLARSLEEEPQSLLLGRPGEGE